MTLFDKVSVQNYRFEKNIPFPCAIHSHHPTNAVKSPINVTFVTKRKHNKKSPRNYVFIQFRLVNQFH